VFGAAHKEKNNTNKHAVNSSQTTSNKNKKTRANLFAPTLARASPAGGGDKLGRHIGFGVAPEKLVFLVHLCCFLPSPTQTPEKEKKDKQQSLLLLSSTKNASGPVVRVALQKLVW